jgi:hypothetical protein
MHLRAGGGISAVLFTGAAVIAASVPATLPPVDHLPMAAHAVQDAGAALAGARRVGGDVAFIQLLQYLGVQEAHGHRHEPGEEHGHADHFIDFLPFSRRFLVLSPYFHQGILFSGGVLGFVLNRPGEALSLLGEAARRDPTFWRYRLYAAAIAYGEGEQPEKVIPLLEEAMKYPDCPGILMHLLANLYKKRGDFPNAIRVYFHILSVSRNVDDVNRAAHALEDLRARGVIP